MTFINTSVNSKSVEQITNKVFCGDSLDVLSDFSSNVIDLVVCSPPYFNLRNYNHDKQIGTERTPKEYINNLIKIFRECKRVLKKTGSIWVNISDSHDDNKSLIGIPERFCLAMQDELGLIRRNTIIWHKPSCMPSSVKDRFTIDFEYFYFFTKEPIYYFKTQYEPMKTIIKEKEYTGQAIKDYAANGVQNPSDIKRRMIESWNKKIKFGGTKYPNEVGQTYSGNVWIPNENLERIKRSVWSINTGNSKESHFATYPEELIEVPIKACTKKRESIVLDPFAGSGTTLLKAQKMQRSYCGIELNPEYVELINRRLFNMITSYLCKNESN
jgi:DNA modification methylase